MDENQSTLLKRIEKDTNGILLTFAILLILQSYDEIWGYDLKRKLEQIFNGKLELHNSTIYTILKSLETKYGILKSEMRERRRYYSLNKGVEDTMRDLTVFFKMFLSLGQNLVDKNITKLLMENN